MKKESEVNDEILTQDELAKEWKTSKRWIETAREKYGLPYHKIGRCIRFKKSEAKVWFEQRKVVA